MERKHGLFSAWTLICPINFNGQASFTGGASGKLFGKLNAASKCGIYEIVSLLLNLNSLLCVFGT